MIDTMQMPETSLLDTGSFYNALASDYDTMTNFEKRFIKEKPFFRLLVDKFRIKTALDAGAGTGFHSILLSKLGVQVTAIDSSVTMLTRLRNHAEEHHVSIQTLESNFQQLPMLVANRRYDAIFCMGNTLAHLLSPEELSQTLESFRGVLNPGGILFMQMLNYPRILEKKEKIQSVREINGTSFIRFYEYQPDHILFNVLRVEKVNGVIQHSLNQTKLRPIGYEEITTQLDHLGYVHVELFGSIAMERYSPTESSDLVILAHTDQP